MYATRVSASSSQAPFWRHVGSRMMDKNSQLPSFDISSNGEVNRVTRVVLRLRKLVICCAFFFIELSLPHIPGRKLIELTQVDSGLLKN